MQYKEKEIPTIRQLVLGDMLNSFCSSLLTNTAVDRISLNFVFDKEDIVAYELNCLIDIQSTIFETRGHYDIKTFVCSGLNKSAIGIFTETSYDTLADILFEVDNRINLKAGDNFMRRSLLRAVYIDDDKIEDILDIFRASIIINYPRECKLLKDNEWQRAKQLAAIHNIRKNKEEIS